MTRASRFGLLFLVLWGLSNAQGGSGGDGGDAVVSNINIVHSKLDSQVSGGGGGDGATTGSETSTAGDGGHGGNVKVTNKNIENSTIANQVSGGEGGDGAEGSQVLAPRQSGNSTDTAGGHGGNVTVTNANISESTIDNMVSGGGGGGGDRKEYPEEVIDGYRSAIRLRLAEMVEVEVGKAEFEMEKRVRLSWDRWMQQWRRWVDRVQQNREFDGPQWGRSMGYGGNRNSAERDVRSSWSTRNASFGRPSCRCGERGSGDSSSIWGKHHPGNVFCCCNPKGCGPMCVYGTWCPQ